MDLLLSLDRIEIIVQFMRHDGGDGVLLLHVSITRHHGDFVACVRQIGLGFVEGNGLEEEAAREPNGGKGQDKRRYQRDGNDFFHILSPYMSIFAVYNMARYPRKHVL